MNKWINEYSYLKICFGSWLQRIQSCVPAKTDAGLLYESTTGPGASTYSNGMEM